MSYPHGPSPYGPPPMSHPNGTTILILGILSLVICLFIGPFAWIMGNTALREIDASGYYYENRSNINAGKICGMIATIIMGVIIGGYGLLIGIAFLAASFSS